MTKLLIEISNAHDARLLIEVAKRLNAKVSIEERDEMSQFWTALSMSGLERAYGDDEPDYDTYVVKEPNPSYGDESR